DQLRVTKKGDAYEVWLAEGSSQQQGDQQGQGQRNAGTAAMKVRLHKDGGITARVGKDDEAGRFSGPKQSAKLKYKKDHWLVVTKDGLVVSKAPEVGQDPIPDDNQ